MSKTKLVGILNITPDSFSDGGFFFDPSNAANQIKSLCTEGADIIDIGAISTRPNNKIISSNEEILRFKKILAALQNSMSNSKVQLSIDSFHYETLVFLENQLTFSIVNDQSGYVDERIIDFVIKTNKKYILMHNLGLPANPNIIVPETVNIVEEVLNWLEEKADYLVKKGLNKEQIIIDPGIGFGKNAKQSWELIEQAEKFLALGFEVMFAHSRKSFLNLITDKAFKDRDPETALVSAKLAQKNIHYLRVHNVKANKEAIINAIPLV